MVKKISILIALSLVLAGCALFFGSPFPAYLPFVEDMVDLSDKVGDVNPDDHGVYKLHLLNNFLFLTIEDQRLIILDINLNVLKEYDGIYGRLGVYSTSADEYFIGDEWYDHNPPNFTDLGASGYMAHGVGYYDSAIANNNNIGVFHTDSEASQLIREVNDAGAGNADITPGMNLEAIAYDNPTGYLFFWNHDNEEAQVMSVDGGILIGTLTPLPSPINLDVSDHDPEFHYTQDGYVVVTRSKSQLFDLVSGEEEKAIYGGSVEQFASAYDIDGDTFYYFNGDNKALYRCNTWW